MGFEWDENRTQISMAFHSKKLLKHLAMITPQFGAGSRLLQWGRATLVGVAVRVGRGSF